MDQAPGRDQPDHCIENDEKEHRLSEMLYPVLLLRIKRFVFIEWLLTL